MLRIHSISIFRKLLKKNKNINYPLLFYGPEKFLIKDTLQKICEKYSLEKKVYFLSDTDWQEIVKLLSSYSLFEENKVIYIIYEFEKLLSNLDKIKDSLSYIKNNKLIFISNEDIIPPKLLVYYFKGKDISSYLQKDILDILKNFEIVYSPKLKKEKIKNLIIQKFSKYKITLTSEALEKLLEIATDLYSLKNETDKIILYALEANKFHLDKKDIELLCFGFEFDFWETLNFYFEDNLEKFCNYLEIAYRENPYLFISMYLGRLKNIIKGKNSYDKAIFEKYKAKVLKLYKFFIDLDIQLRKEYDIKKVINKLLFLNS